MSDDQSFSLPPRPPAPSGSRGEALADRLRIMRHDARVGALLLVACACAAGVFWFRSGISTSAGATANANTAGPSRAASSAAPPTTTTKPASSSTVVVHVAGAVKQPGVVTLAGGSRVVDALEAAGGARANADLDRLNLAAKLTDGERVAVPVKGQPAPALEAGASGGAASGDAAPTASGPVNLNSATAQQLETLPGIGPTLAQAIIAERDRSGGFHSVEDLRRVHGIGDGRFAQVRALVTV
ncbi:MAG: competence protein ComEA [Actinomycetota bacterium]|nr:competence protein ComEA [Actinomycetota bacterium]